MEDRGGAAGKRAAPESGDDARGATRRRRREPEGSAAREEVPRAMPGVLRFYEDYMAERGEAAPAAVPRGAAAPVDRSKALVEHAMNEILAETVEYIPKDSLFTTFAQAAKATMKAHIGLLTLFDATLDVQHFIGREGTPLPGTEMRHSFCRHMRGFPELLVRHASQDERFRTNPLVTGELASLEFYYGIPVLVEDEQVGALCVLSAHTQDAPTESQKEILQNIAASASQCLVERKKMVKRIAAQSSKIVTMLQKELRWESEQKFLQAEMRLRDESINHVCHEIRSHMSTIRMTLEDVKNAARFGMTADVHELESALHSLECQDRVLRMRLDVGRLLSGQYQLQLVTFELSEMVNLVLQRQGIAARTAVDYVCDMDGELWVKTDAYLIEQVLDNLVSNARKHTHEGFVRVSVELLPSEVPTEMRLRIVVFDTGCGIRPEKLARLFHRYSSMETEGTGLGLFLVDRIASAMQGYVRVRWTRTMDFKYSESPGFTSRFSATDTPLRRPSTFDSPLSGAGGAQRGRAADPAAPGEPGEATPAPSPPSDRAFPENARPRSGTAFEFVVPVERLERGSAASVSPSLPVAPEPADAGALPVYRTRNADEPILVNPSPAQRQHPSPIGPPVRPRPAAPGPSQMATSAPSSEAPSEQLGQDGPPGGAATTEHTEEAAVLRELDGLESARVFIVDDTNALRTSLERRFRTLDGPLPWAIETARTAEEALGRLRRDPFHILVLDENMAPAGGALSGTEATAILRSQGYDGVIVGFSGYENMHQKQRSAGADICWPKPPPSAREMRRQIRLALERRCILGCFDQEDQEARFRFAEDPLPDAPGGS